MSGFVPVDFAEPLDWSFRPYVDAEGTTPEPSDKQLARFARAYLEANGVLFDATPEEQAEHQKTMASWDEDQIVTFWEKLKVAVADVTGGSPSREQIDGLPRRVLVAYASDLYGRLTNPQKPAATTSNPATSN